MAKNNDRPLSWLQPAADQGRLHPDSVTSPTCRTNQLPSLPPSPASLAARGRPGRHRPLGYMVSTADPGSLAARVPPENTAENRALPEYMVSALWC